MQKIGAIAGMCLLSVALAIAQEQPAGAPSGNPHGNPHGSQGGGWGSLFMSPVEGEGFKAGIMLERIMNDPELTQKVGLSEEQVKKLSAAISEMKKEQIKLKAELDLSSLEQADKIAQTNINEKALMAAVEKTGELRTKLAKVAVSQLVLVKNTLSADQIKKIKQLARGAQRERINEWKERKKEEVKERRQGEGKEPKPGENEVPAPPVESNQ